MRILLYRIFCVRQAFFRKNNVFFVFLPQNGYGMGRKRRKRGKQSEKTRRVLQPGLGRTGKTEETDRYGGGGWEFARDRPDMESQG